MPRSPARGRPGKSDAALAATGSWRLAARQKARRESESRDRVANRPRPRRPVLDPRRTMLALPGYDPRKGSAGYVFRPERARAAIRWIRDRLTHTRGSKAAGPDPLELERWQQGFLANLFGWFERTGLRRYRQAFLAVPRKNGKSTLLAAVVNYVACEDGEPGAELYSVASDRDQAGLVFEIARQQVQQDVMLAERVKPYTHALHYDGGRSVYKRITSRPAGKHGLNPHLVVVDELHAIDDREIVDVMVTGTGARAQPLVLYATTSDFDRVSICNETWDYFAKVRDGVIEDPTSLPAIFEAGRDEDWTDERTWRKANPNLGVSVSKAYIAAQVSKARHTPALENTVRRLHLNQRTEQDVRLVPLADWARCAAAPAPRTDEPAWAGLDLSATRDMTAFALWFPESRSVLPWYWLPSDNLEERERQDRAPYSAWVRDGLLELTEGNVVDYDRIRLRIGEICKRWLVREVAVDPWQSVQIQGQLQADGLSVVQFGQGFKDMNAPTKEVLRLAAAGELRHGDHPILRWNASNVEAQTDSRGNIRPRKPQGRAGAHGSAGARARIDGFVCLVMAVGRALASPPDGGGSVYDERGLVVL